MASAAGEPRCYELETIQSEVGVYCLDELGVLTDERRLSAGANYARVWTEFFFHASDDAVDQSYVSIEQTALHAAGGRGTDHIRGLLNLDSRQLGSVLIQRLRRNHNARRNHATTVLAGRGDGVKCRCRSEIHDDCGMAIFVHDSDRIDDPVRTDLAGIVVENRNAGIFMRDE